MGLVPELQPVGKAHHIDAGVHGGNVDAESLREPSQEQIKKIFNKFYFRKKELID